MCGICGFQNKKNNSDQEIRHQVLRMNEVLSHRGPDDSGVWVDNEVGLSLAFKRLSILELTSAGSQPMVSPSGRSVIVFNGEIYNHQELRDNLEKEGGHFEWRGRSDTETLLAALRHWGVEKTLRRLNGMFAFAYWDRSERVLYLARDRMGIKPIYYGRQNGTFLFGSELKAIREHPDCRGIVDRQALTLYMRYGYVPTPWSIYQGIYKLPPAHYITVTESGNSVSDPRSYWDLREIAEIGAAEEKQTPNQLIEELENLLLDAVNIRMIADVPLGAFLSGGYDSSLVVALMQAQSIKPVKTFSIGFHEKGFNEAKYAKEVAAYLGTNHTELYVKPEEVLNVIPKIPSIWDEPFADSSQIPTYLVSHLTRQHVTVSLSGDGGDEQFFGYNRYIQGARVGRFYELVPGVMRQLFANLLGSASVNSLNKIGGILPGSLKNPLLGDRVHKFSTLIKEPNILDFYHYLISHWKDPGDIVINGTEPKTLFDSYDKLPNLPSIQEQMMYLDAVTYLPDDILTKVDRASMAVSLEARVPLLDHRVVEFGWKVPTSLKYHRGQRKWLLRQVLYKYLPQELMDRPKMGFGVPIEHWLRGPIREWAESLLNEQRLHQEGFFTPEPIQNMWKEHLSGERKWHYYLWDVLMFQLWLDHNQK
jgi:asparagine synthase (glutamine-hydrolysing)